MNMQDFKNGDKVIFSAYFGNCDNLVGKVCTGNFKSKMGTYFYVTVIEETERIPPFSHFAWGEITNIKKV